MRAILGVLGGLAMSMVVHADDGTLDVEARLARLQAQLEVLQSENRALRSSVEALARKDPAPSSNASASPTPATPAAVPPSSNPSPQGPATAAPAGSSNPGPTIKVGGQLRVRPEYRDRLKADAAGSTTDTFFGQRARASVGVSTDRLRAFVEVQDARNWGTEGSTASNDHNVDLHQAYLNLPDLVRPGLSLTVGRQELAYGDERLLGALDWATTARSFDGGVARYAWKGGAVDVLGALVNDRKTAARGTGDMILTGAYGRFLRSKPGRELDLYILNLGDGAKAVGETGAADTSRITTFGARSRYTRPSGLGVQASAEGSYQTGHRGENPHRAYAWAVTGGYTFGARYRPALRFEWDGASGDGEAKDGRSREFNNLFPTNHAIYGYADLLGWRNMNSLRATLAIAPRPGQQLSLDVHRFRLREAGGAWKDAGGTTLGQDASGKSGRDIGDELDLLYRFPLRKELTLLLGYSAFFPGAFAESVRGTGTQSFGYAQVLFKF